MKGLLYLALGLCLISAGCTTLEKLFPSQVDESGNKILGSHYATDPVKQTAPIIPYGETAVAGLLLVWNLIERIRGNKYKKGLAGTIQAINQVKEDPKVVADWERFRETLKTVHNATGVRGIINALLVSKV